MLKSISSVFLSSLILLTSCTSIITNANSTSPISSKSTNFSKDGDVQFSELKGFVLKKHFIKIATNYNDDSIEGFKVLKTKEDFESYTEVNSFYLSEGLKPDSIDFSKNWVLVIAKVTNAYMYEGKVTSLKMLNAELLAEYTYNITYTVNPMGNDYIREVNSFTKIQPVEYKELKINISKNSRRTNLKNW